MPGYPDFQAYPQWRTGNVAASNSPTLTPGTHTLYSDAVSNYGSMLLRINPSLGSQCVVTVTWYLDDALTELVGTDTWKCNATTFLDVIVPIKAQYVQVTLDNTAAVDWTGSTYISLLNVLTPDYKYPVSAQIVAAATVTVPASTSETYFPTVITRGPAMLSFHPFDTAGKLLVVINQLDETGAEVGLIADFGTPAAIINNVFYIPDVLWELKVQNLDSAATHEFSATVVAV